LFLLALWDDSFLLGFGLLSLALLGSLPTSGTNMPVPFGSETTSYKQQGPKDSGLVDVRKKQSGKQRFHA
jgi:hypothetical protein